MGGHEEWSEFLRQLEPTVDRWLSFQYRNVHVAVLAPNVASATAEYEHSRILVAGDTISVRGAWTYVFSRVDGRWGVIQTNGTHVEY